MSYIAPALDPVIAAHSTQARALAARCADVANILDFGGGLGGDDALALRQAIAANTKTILVPPGSYTFRSTVQPYGAAADPCCAEINGRSDTFIIAYGATFLIDNAISGPVPVTHLAFTNNSKNVGILGGTFVGNTTGLTSSQENTAFDFDSVTGLVIRDCKITGTFNTAIAGVYAFDSLIENVQGFNLLTGFDISHIQSLTIRRCTFFATAPGAGVTGVSLHHDTPTVNDNVVTTEAGAARPLIGSNSNDLRVIDSLFDGFGNGIAIDAVAGAVIAGTTLRNGFVAGSANLQGGLLLYRGTAAIAANLPTTSITVQNCDIYGNGSSGSGQGGGANITSTSGTVSDVTFDDCRIYDNTNTGIASTTVAAVAGLVVNDCDFRSRGGAGQLFERTTGLTPSKFTSTTAYLLPSPLTIPNNNGLYMQDASGTGQIMLSLSPSNVTFIRPGSAPANIALQNYAGTTLLTVDSGGNVVTASVPVTSPQFNLSSGTGANIRSGTGAASGTQPAGSVWLRTDGGTGSRVYVSAGGGTWNAVAGV
jgi:hypothetical protein